MHAAMFVFSKQPVADTAVIKDTFYDRQDVFAMGAATDTLYALDLLKSNPRAEPDAAALLEPAGLQPMPTQRLHPARRFPPCWRELCVCVVPTSDGAPQTCRFLNQYT